MGANRLYCQTSLSGHGCPLNEDGYPVSEVLDQLILDIPMYEVGDIFTIRAVNSQGVEVFVAQIFISDAILQDACRIGDLLSVEAC